MTDYAPVIALWLATAGLIGGTASALWARRQLHQDPPSNVIVLPSRAQRSGPTHVVRREAPMPMFFDQDALA